ncbi:PadR family transcriptional regulator [Labedaea rhizosphaerae]|uniref:PadR family transcriptional regulator n=1 Tax=Labedaea rhizosphaerae TaxID=598644 RepID=A0A4R6SK57_LABRH|nr:PadR family transcriptional regulator [Labedaea rhizosphaerae]TDQ04488.1 PadR family transcriptional regulator [Labedaea rhizosphaerae]
MSTVGSNDHEGVAVLAGSGPPARARKLNATSYVVLGMLSYGPATSYDLKQRVGGTIGNFWAFAHSQLYDEPARLVVDGLVAEKVEHGGRRKRTYSITAAGRQALQEWLSENTDEQTEVRDLGLLKLFFATWGTRRDVAQLAHDRHRSHRERAEGYEQMYDQIVDVGDQWQVKTLELGLRYERCVEQFWADFIAELDGDAPDKPVDH